jgi:hypothetical protein
LLIWPDRNTQIFYSHASQFVTSTQQQQAVVDDKEQQHQQRSGGGSELVRVPSLPPSSSN